MLQAQKPWIPFRKDHTRKLLTARKLEDQHRNLKTSQISSLFHNFSHSQFWKKMSFQVRSLITNRGHFTDCGYVFCDTVLLVEALRFGTHSKHHNKDSASNWVEGNARLSNIPKLLSPRVAYQLLSSARTLETCSTRRAHSKKNTYWFLAKFITEKLLVKVSRTLFSQRSVRYLLLTSR